MGIADVELRAQRANTVAFIKADSFTVVLERSVWASDGAGGTVKGDPAPLPAQVMRLIPLRDVGSVQRTTADGQAVEPTYALLGSYDADMERWDTFLLDDVEYEVVFVNQSRQYETKGEVFYRG
jgi:hypothetical protein